MEKNEQQLINFLSQLEHPLITEIQLLRSIIRQSAPQLSEHIKWNAPSFALNGEDCITFNLPPNQKTVRLVFHRGAKVKEQPSERLLTNSPDWFKWAANDRAVATFTHLDDIKTKAEATQTLIKEWLRSI